MKKVVCAYCESLCEKEARDIARSEKAGLNLYCNRKCAGLGRRTIKTVEQKKAEKSVYDKEYRKRDPVALKKSKHEWFKKTYDPVKAAVERKAKMPRHVAYCRRPEYKAYKQQYDKEFLAKKLFGEFAECFLLTQQLEEEVLSRMTKYEIGLTNGTINKAQLRRRENV